VGSLTPGRYADLIAVEGDVLRDLGTFRHVAFVMKGGVVVKDEVAGAPSAPKPLG